MNKHILFVIDHLANPEKYTKAQLEANRRSAYDADDDDVAYFAAAYTAAHWVDEYFEVTGEDKQTYIDKLGE